MALGLVLGGLDFEIGEGEIVCIVGPSGCGKTTALRVASGLIAPSGGELIFAGAPVRGPRRDVAMSFRIIPRRSCRGAPAEGNVSLALEAWARRAASGRKRIAALLKRVGLAGQADKYPTQLSGGMQQRLQIARCLAQEPKALMMDEPFGALDAMTRQTLQDEMLEIARRQARRFSSSPTISKRRSISATG